MEKLKPERKCANHWLKFLLFALFCFLQTSQRLQAEPVPLHLEVYVNGHSTQLIAAFSRHSDGRFSTTASELIELGLKPNKDRVATSRVFLDNIEGLTYRYNEKTQSLYVDTNKSNRLAKNYIAGKKQDRRDITKSDFGAVLNYSVNASGNSGLDTADSQFEGISALLNMRSFGRYGVLSSSAVLSSDQSSDNLINRLETNWSYSDEGRLITYTIGDIISGGPSWARPSRLGGVKVSRNFSIRPDIITQPVANVSGSAALPSTVDVYVKNVKAHSQRVSPGPFTLSNIPAITGNGTARIVVRDATGHETVTYNDFFLSPQLLGAGYWDFSAELGVVRGNYGETSFDYGRTPYFSGSVKYGWQDFATLDGHIEAGPDLILAGGGVTLPVAAKALLSLSGASSLHKNGNGFLAAASLETTLFGLTINARSQRSFGQFKDIAAISAADFKNHSGNTSAILSAAEFPTAIDQVSIGIPFADWGASLNASFIHTQTVSSKESSILAASFSKKLFGDSSFFGTAFADINNLKSPTFFAGLSIPLGTNGSVSTGGTYNRNQGWRASATYSKPLKNEIGSFGWRIQDQEGQTSSRNASASYRAKAATLEGRISQTKKMLEYSAFVQGAFAFTNSGVFAANRIDDSFAIVDVGAADIPILHENRPIGKTGPNGKFLIPNMHSYGKNKISIDPSKLPVNANIPATSKIVIPSYRSGVTVKFGVQSQTSSAIVIVHDAQGKPLNAGTQGQMSKDQSNVIIGFDGRGFVEKLSSHNQITFKTKTGACQVEFNYQTKVNTQVEIGPLLCK